MMYKKSILLQIFIKSIVMQLISLFFVINSIATIPVSFVLQDGSITANQINDMEAITGQILSFDGTEWVPDNLEGLVYIGTWDASTNTPSLYRAGNPGEYYIVSKGAETVTYGGPGTDSWTIGDWVVWNEILIRWDKIGNSSTVQSFAGRTGAVTIATNDYTWEQIDKTGSSVNDISDVESTLASTGQLIKWDGSTWIVSNDLSEDGSNIITSTPLNTTGGPSPTISISKADATNSGHISSSDWNVFNSKQDALSGTATQFLQGDHVLATFSSSVLNTQISGFSATIGSVTSSDTILEAINKMAGNITLKEPAILKGDLAESNSNILTITNGADSVAGQNALVEVKAANSTTNGYLSSSDWNTFNDKFASTTVDNATIEINGGSQIEIKDGGINSDKISLDLETKSTDYTITTDDNNKVFLISGITDIIITLPVAASAGSGFMVTIKNLSSSKYVIIDGDNLETIDGKDASVLESQYAYETIVSDGTNWYIIAQEGNFDYCPIGFIAVPGDSTLGTNDFCVMKYEAKVVDSSLVSQPIDNPLTAIDATAAFSMCNSMNVGGFDGTFSLISNPEWMTIARNAENISTNWSGGIVGVGDFSRGWAAQNSVDGFNNTDVAPSTGPSCLYNTASDSCGSTGPHKHKRSLTLSNNEEIWDFAGNVSEWVDWDDSIAGFTSGPIDATDAAWMEITSLDGSVVTLDLQSLGGYDSTQQIGQWIGGTGGATLRGGNYSDGDIAGAFNLNLQNIPGGISLLWGFRCVYRP